MPRPVVAWVLVSAAILAAAAGPSLGRGQEPAPPGWRPPHYVSSPIRAAALAPLPARAQARLVVLVSIDGLRPDALGPRTPTLRRLAAEGASARDARTIERSSTLPAHASMVSGVDVEGHGLRWNSYRPSRGRIGAPTVFSVARQAGLSSSLFVGKRKLEHLVREGELDRFAVGGVFCQRVNRDALPYLSQAAPGVHLVHYADVDSAGHSAGWMTARYHESVARADACLAELVATLAARPDGGDLLLVVTSDHGGHGRSHGSARAHDVRIPWIAWGGGVGRGSRPPRVDTRDTAATILAALGLPRPAALEGRPVPQALGRAGAPRRAPRARPDPSVSH